MFEGMPVWHVSVARIAKDRRTIKPRYSWTSAELLDAARIVGNALDGIGNHLHEWRENGETAIHVRRQLAQPEIDFLHSIRADCPVFTHGNARKSE